MSSKIVVEETPVEDILTGDKCMVGSQIIEVTHSMTTKVAGDWMIRLMTADGAEEWFDYGYPIFKVV